MEKQLKFIESLPLDRQEAEYRKLGFKGKAILFQLQCLDLGKSICIDLMHFFANFSKVLFRITINCAKLGKPHHQNNGYCLEKDIWDRIDSIVLNMVRTSWFAGGRRPSTPLNSGMKCITHKFFILHIIVPLLYSVGVNRNFLLPLADIIDILRILDDKKGFITTSEALKYKKEMEESYFQLEKAILGKDYNPLYMDFFTSNTHNLLHIIPCMIEFGPPWLYSQWALESKLGVMRNLTHQRFNPESNLNYNIDVFQRIQLFGSIPFIGIDSKNEELISKKKSSRMTDIDGRNIKYT